jgi:hypothetical protein
MYISNVLEGVAELIESYGCNPVEIAKRVGLSCEAFYSADLLISEMKVNDLFEEAAMTCQDRFFGLKIAQTKGFDALGVLWLLACNANTVGEQLTDLAGNMASYSHGASYDITSEKNLVSPLLSNLKLSR